MDAKPRLLIYDRKEVSVLILLGLMVAVFAFTLGVHLGKRMAPHSVGASAQPAAPAGTQPDETANRQELTEQARGAPHAVDESLNEEIHDEVSRTGIKMDTSKQVELPRTTRGPQVHAQPENPVAQKPADEAGIPAALRAAPPGKYTIQVGAYATLSEARDRVDSLEAVGLKPLLRAVDLKQKGRWYRVFVGGYGSKDEAEEAGNGLRGKHIIETFIVSHATVEK